MLARSLVTDSWEATFLGLKRVKQKRETNANCAIRLSWRVDVFFFSFFFIVDKPTPVTREICRHKREALANDANDRRTVLLSQWTLF